MKRKLSLLTIFFTLLALVIPAVVSAQLTLFPPPTPGAVPLDPASWLMLAAGGAIIAKKVYKEKISR